MPELPPGFWEFLKTCPTAGVLLLALAGFGYWFGPRVDKLLDAMIAFVNHTADVKPQIDKLAEAQKTSCRFAPPAGAQTSAQTGGLS